MGSTKLKEQTEKKKDEKKVEEGAKEEAKKPERKSRPEKHEMRELVRIFNTDLDGTKPIILGITGIKGISYAMSKAICNVSGLDPKIKLTSLKEEDIRLIEKIIRDPLSAGIPLWMINRKRDRDSGKNLHLCGPDLDVARRFDIQRLIDIKSYKGSRHMLGLPARGQRTRSCFRKGKSVGVLRKTVKIVQEKGKEKKE